MAEDLTPAEAPEPGAELVPVPVEHEPSTAVVPAEPAAAATMVRPPQSAEPHRSRFRLLFAALGVIVVAAIAAEIALLGGSRVERVVWSQWAPSANGASAAQQIANHVAPAYRLPNGDQLVGVTGGALEFARLPAVIAVRDQDGGDISFVEGDTLRYTLCGLGQDCAIEGGKPSPERHLILQREAFELALYSFRYVAGTDSVIVLLPPRKGKQASTAMLFREKDVASQLDRPLRATLAAPAPRPGALIPAEASRIQLLTNSTLFNFKLTQGQDAQVYLVLNKIKLR